MQTQLPLYRKAIDWDQFERDHPAPDVWSRTVFKWSADQVHDLQERRFRKTMEIGWSNDFYRRRWSAAGIEPGDIRTLDDLQKLPIFTSDDIKDDQREFPPYGSIAGIDAREYLKTSPLKLHTSGGTTGKARPALAGARDWELMGLLVARTLYMQGARPGDVLQIPSTAALTQFGWVFYKAAHDYLGTLPVTTGSGVVTPARKQLEFAFDLGTNIIASFPEYLTSLAKACRAEFGRSIRDLELKFLPTYLGPDTEGILRKELEELFGCPVYDNYGCNELSNAAFEGPDKDGLYLLEDCTYVEILDVDTGKRVADGEEGNIVATSLVRTIPPIIRFNVRDITRIKSSGVSALGSAFRRMDHFLGRSDDMVKIRGTNVYPMACLNAVKSDRRTTGEWVCIARRTVNDGAIRDELTVRVEIQKGVSDTSGLVEALAERLRVDLGLKVDVELAEEGSLAEIANIGREGKAKRLVDLRFAK
jgi:phenylacetate-CoA ligase